jgi:capsular polysaccharide export protein
MKSIGVYIGSIEELRFFLRLADGFSNKGYSFCFFSNKLSLIFRIITKGYNFRIIYESSLLTEIPDLSRCFEYRMKYLSYKEAKMLYSSVYNTLKICAETFCFEYLFIWNGLSVQSMAVSDFAKTYSIKTRYFELSNLPGRIFADPEGVNAQASIYRDVSILEKYTVSLSDYNKWKLTYLQLKEKLIQSNCIKKKINYLFLIDLIGFYLLNISKSGETRPHRKLKEVLSRGINITYDDYDIKRNRYILLPLQVNNDSQLIFNSDIGNLKAVEASLQKASEVNADLLVRIHPLEFDKDFIIQLLLMKQQYHFYIINYSIIELIKNALLVICINSTAGLDAKIIGKETEFLGRSFYSFMTEELMRNYILGYLLAAEYISGETINEEVINNLINLER